MATTDLKNRSEMIEQIIYYIYTDYLFEKYIKQIRPKVGTLVMEDIMLFTIIVEYVNKQSLTVENKVLHEAKYPVRV